MERKNMSNETVRGARFYVPKDKYTCIVMVFNDFHLALEREVG